MLRYYISGNSFQTIILAKTQDAAQMLFQISHPGIEIKQCVRMVA